MSADMITQGFSRDDYRGPRTLKIETDGGTVTVTVGLTDVHGRQVTAVHINPDDESRGGDGNGDVWHLVDGCRLVRQEPGGDQVVPDPPKVDPYAAARTAADVARDVYTRARLGVVAALIRQDWPEATEAELLLDLSSRQLSLVALHGPGGELWDGESEDAPMDLGLIERLLTEVLADAQRASLGPDRWRVDEHGSCRVALPPAG